jgi:hypothetical protein
MDFETYEAHVAARWARKGRAEALRLLDQLAPTSADFELMDILNNLSAIAERVAKQGIEGQ